MSDKTIAFLLRRLTTEKELAHIAGLAHNLELETPNQIFGCQIILIGSAGATVHIGTHMLNELQPLKDFLKHYQYNPILDEMRRAVETFVLTGKKEDDILVKVKQ